MNISNSTLPVKGGRVDRMALTSLRDEEQGHHITDGSEFLDDAIRMNDQPLVYLEENIGTVGYEKVSTGRRAKNLKR